MTRDCGQSREDSTPLDRGTGKIKEQRSKSGYLSNSGTRSPPPQRSAVLSIRSRCRAEQPARYSARRQWKYRTGRSIFAP
ncbi:unnamed protein product [Staurois parvus]|uniref:Uncharacterized protein n=1 Tax=Staurois parvus TaxID=386267 RepID=A0ABN9BWC0_9NEOB|nr:unnamed protein product [Staurois parvus]